MKSKRLIFEACLAGMGIALAWSLRGQFGHLKGAMIPGACFALMPAFLMKDENWRESAGQALILGSAGFAVGGHIGYGALFDAVAHASAFGEVKKEFWQLLGIGLIWGALGGTFLGFAFSEKHLGRLDLQVLVSVLFAWLFLLGLLNLEQWDLLFFTAGLLVLHAYNFFHKKSSIVWMLGLAGALALAAGFLFSAILLTAGYAGYLGRGPAWWVLRDQTLGFTAGSLFWIMISGLRDFRFRRRSAVNIMIVQRAGFLVWLSVIPLINTWNVVTHWLISRPLEQIWPYAALCGAFLLAGGCIVLAKPDLDFLNPKLRRTLAGSSLFFSVYMAAIAIGKEKLVMPRHWEEAYTFFILSICFLSALLPVQWRRLSEEN